MAHTAHVVAGWNVGCRMCFKKTGTGQNFSRRRSALCKQSSHPDASLTAKVASYNATGRFVVLSFPIGQMPKMDQTFFLYRAGLKVGEVKITGPQRDNNIIADLVTGEAQVGDEVREQ